MLAVSVAVVAGVAAAAVWRVSEAFEDPYDASLSGRQVDHRPIEKAFDRAASERPTEVVDFAEFVPGEWDVVRRFGGYSTGDTVSETIGHDWGEGHETEQIAREHEEALVFLRRGEVVAWVGHLSGASLACVRRAATRFYVREWTYDDGSNYRLLVPAGRGGMRSPAARRCVRRNPP